MKTTDVSLEWQSLNGIIEVLISGPKIIEPLIDD